MKRLLSLLCITLLCVTAVFAQDNDEINIDEAEGFNYQMNQPGDQYLKISLGVVLPLNFPDINSVFDDTSKLNVGGMGTLGYHYFLNHYVAIGIEAGFGYNSTIGSNIFTYVPILATVTYQPTAGRFEFPLTLGAGFGWETYLNQTYFPALIVKPEAGVHFRISPSL